MPPDTRTDISIIPVEQKTYLLRDEKVILDSDLADLYRVQTKVLNQVVHSNQKRFPFDFVFQLTKDEFKSLRSQSVTTKPGRGGVVASPAPLSWFSVNPTDGLRE